MARYAGTVTTDHSSEEVFAYLSDLRSVAEWDPSIDGADLTLGEAGALGARYEIKVEFVGRTLTIDYQSTAVEPVRRLEFRAENDSVEIRDVATIRPRPGGGSEVTWDADLTPKGIRKVFDPFLSLAFRRIGRRAEEGLGERLSKPLSAAPSARTAA